jgi:hypothetical protein
VIGLMNWWVKCKARNGVRRCACARGEVHVCVNTMYSCGLLSIVTAVISPRHGQGVLVSICSPICSKEPECVDKKCHVYSDAFDSRQEFFMALIVWPSGSVDALLEVAAFRFVEDTVVAHPCCWIVLLLFGFFLFCTNTSSLVADSCVGEGSVPQ